MATEQEQICITIKAEADLSSYQYKLVSMTNAGYGTIPAAVGTSHLIGVLLNKPAAYGRPAKVCIGGHTKCLTGGAVASLGYLTHLNNGYVGLSTTSGDKDIGINLSTSAGSGEYVEMILGHFRHP